MSAQLALGAKYASKLATIEGLASVFPKSVEQVKALAESAKNDATAALAHILDASTPATFDDVCCATDAARAEFSIVSGALSVTKSTHPVKEMRDACTAALTELNAFSIDNFGSNRALFKKFDTVKSSGHLGHVGNDRDAKLYFYEESIKEWQRQGLGLSDEKLEESKSLKKKISDLGIAFDRNVAEYKKEMIFTLDQLQGVPQAAIDSLKKPEGEGNEDKRICGLDYPTYFAIMKHCEVAETRKAVMSAFESRAAPENLQVLKEIIEKRQQFAALVGFESYSALDIDSKMAKTTENVRKFINDLVPRLQNKWAQEKKALLEDVHPSVKITEDGKIPSWDITFMMTQYAKKKLSVDETKISEYFPTHAVVDAVIECYGKFFSLEFTHHKNLVGDKALWHEDAEILEVHNIPRNLENPSASLVGYMILDLFPRGDQGKYGHACCFSAIPSFPVAENKWSPPVAVLICNFPKGTKEKPGLMQHSDAVTLFHECGHGWHTLLSRTSMASAAGTRVDRTFVEVPSQCLENWMWDNEVLAKVSKHYQTGEPIDAALIDAKINARNFFSGRDNLRQLTFATYSLEIFDKAFASQKIEDLDTTKLFDDIRKRILPDLEYDQSGRFEAAFSHLIGYGSCYYGYLWSLVLSDDIFFFIKNNKGLLDPVLGKRYREKILLPGGSAAPAVLLEDFLERPANNEAFLKHLSISA